MHSLSKRSNLAGYRCAFVAGDPAVVGELLAVRKNLGLIMPGPQQHAMTAPLGDADTSSSSTPATPPRRAPLVTAFESAGFRVDHSEGSLYLWGTREEDCWTTVARLAELGILVAPGQVLRPGRADHVRVALTAVDERVAAALRRSSQARGATRFFFFFFFFFFRWPSAAFEALFSASVRREIQPDPGGSDGPRRAAVPLSRR